MPVCYGFAQWSYGGDTVHAGRATVMPRNKPFAARCVPVSPGCFLIFETTETSSCLTPVQHGESRFNAVLAAALRCDPGGPRSPGTENQDSVNEANPEYPLPS